MIKELIINDLLTLKPENGYYIQAVKNLGYGTKYSYSDILSKHGIKLGNALFKNKVFSVDLIIGASSQDQLITRRSDLFKYLTVNNYASDDKIDFEFVLANDISLIISGIIKDVTNDISVSDILTTPVNFVIETEYPFITSKQQYQITIPISVGGGGEVPMAIPFDMSEGVMDHTAITNGGNVFAYPVFTLFGPLTNPVLLDKATNKYFSIAATIAAGNYYVIDTYQRTVLDASGNNQLDKLTGDFLVLNAGENDIKLTTDNISDSGYIQTVFSNHYASI